MAALVMRIGGRAVMVAISERAAPGTKLRFSDIPCFDDWKRFCFVLREIASGDNGRPLWALEAQRRAQAVLTECGYAWRRVTANGNGKIPDRTSRLTKPPTP